MAKRKKRKNQKQKRATGLILVMLAVIFLIIGFFVIEAIGDKGNDETDVTDSQYQNDIDTGYDVDGDFSYDEESESEIKTESDTQTDIQSEIETEDESEETEFFSETLPVNVDDENIADKIISRYTDYMGFSEGALYINESEITSNGDIYTYTLRMKSDSANKLIGDVKVDIGTGEVSDSMGTVEWNIND